MNFQGTEYVVSDQVFKQFKAGYEQAQKQGKQQNQSLSSLGLDPRPWLTNPKNEGEAKVGDDDTIKITGGVDVNKLLDDVNQALKKTRELGVQGTEQLPSQLTEAQKKQVADAVKNPRVEIYTGKEDKILRRMVIALGHRRAGGQLSGSADIKLDLAISDLNEDQEISEPSGAKPFDQLLSQLGGLGLGGLGGGGRRRLARRRPAAARPARREQREPREVLPVHRGRGQRRRQGAQVRRPADQPVAPARGSSASRSSRRWAS